MINRNSSWKENANATRGKKHGKDSDIAMAEGS